MQNLKLTIWMALPLLAMIPTLRAGELPPESAGLRAGFSTRPANDRFVQTELFTDWNLPWNLDWDKNWRLQSQLELSAGWLNRQHADAFVGSLGPQLRLRRNALQLQFTAGVNLTLLSRHAFGDWNLGSPVQFTSHAGLHWSLNPRWEIGYRLQHMSNGGFRQPNPGLNLHMFSVSYHF